MATLDRSLSTARPEAARVLIVGLASMVLVVGAMVAATKRASSDRAAKFAVPTAFFSLALCVVAFWAGVSMSLGFGAFTIGTWAVREAHSRGWRIWARVSQVVGLVAALFGAGIYVYFAIVDRAPGMPI